MNKKLFKLGLGVSALAASIFIAGCGDDSNSASDNGGKKADDEVSYETFDDLPKCNKKHDEETAYVEEDDVDVICNADEGEWATVYATKKKMDDCTKKLQDELAYVEKTEEYYLCDDGEWTLLENEEDEAKSSSSKAKSDSNDSDDSDDGDEKSSSSKKTVFDDDEEESGSSKEDKNDSDDKGGKTETEVKQEVIVRVDTIAGTVIKTDTLVQHQTIVIEDTTYVTVEVTKKDENGEVVKDEEGNTVVEMELVATAPTKTLSDELNCSNAMFCGKDGDGRVETTVGDKDLNMYGYWYTYTDEKDAGTTAFSWPYDFDENGSFVGNSVSKVAGIKGKVTFGKTIDYPYAALAFNLVDDEDNSADISKWGGLCAIYNSSQPIYLQVKPSDEKATTGFNDPMAILPSTNGKNVIIDISWDLFQQETGWGTEVSTAAVLKKASKIAFKFSGKPGSSNSFIIYAIGKKGTCEGSSSGSNSGSTSGGTSGGNSGSGSSTIDSDEAIDVFGGKGDFWNGTGSLSYFDTYVGNYDIETKYGSITVKTNDDDNKVLQFYTNYGVDDDDFKYYVQLTKEFSLQKGYAYYIEISGYDWYDDDEDPESYEVLHVGLQDPETYNNYLDDDGSVWTTDHNDWTSGVYSHCDANTTGRFYINGASNNDATGIHIQSIKLMKTPVSCK